MAGMDMKVLLESIAGQLQPSDIEELKYILKDSFTGMFHSNQVPWSGNLWHV